MIKRVKTFSHSILMNAYCLLISRSTRPTNSPISRSHDSLSNSISVKTIRLSVSPYTTSYPITSSTIDYAFTKIYRPLRVICLAISTSKNRNSPLPKHPYTLLHNTLYVCSNTPSYLKTQP